LVHYFKREFRCFKSKGQQNIGETKKTSTSDSFLAAPVDAGTVVM